MGVKGSEEIKFVADKMLGRLAKWLRIIGQDVTYGSHLSGHGLLRAARKEDRLILTRDKGIRNMSPPDYLLIESNHFREQLKQVVRACGLDPLRDVFTRCIECNARLEPVSKGAVEKTVLPYVFASHQRFSLCPACKRIYWPATHQERMLEELRAMGFKAPGI